VEQPDRELHGGKNMRHPLSKLLRLVALGALASTWLNACGSPGHSIHASQGQGGDTAGPGSSGSTGGSASGSDGGSTSGSTGSATSGSSSSASSSGGSVWAPTAAAPIHFHWMIGSFTTADILPDQQGQVVYDIDGEGATAADVAAIHAAGAIAVCYVDVGTLEPGRSDYDQFPASVIGPAVQGWPGEKWLLVTAANQGVLLPLMQARFVDWCQSKGFDAIEPDNLDGWTNISNLTETDNVAYDLAIGGLAHALPLSIGLKNVMTDLDPSQYPTFLSTFDWALNEQCYEEQECDTYTAAGSFIPAGKAVFDVEYNVSPDCAQANQAHMNAQKTDLDLVGATASGYAYSPCVPDAQATW
jgi:Glycoside-hydrolase family GH114